MCNEGGKKLSIRRKRRLYVYSKLGEETKKRETTQEVWRWVRCDEWR